jgi:hypothetical protein
METLAPDEKLSDPDLHNVKELRDQFLNGPLKGSALSMGLLVRTSTTIQKKVTIFYPLNVRTLKRLYVRF